jgi:hypothetical protein
MIYPIRRSLPFPRAVRLALAIAVSLTAVIVRAEPIVRLLTIGNSFADDATRHLPGLAKAGGKELEIFRANLGGHSLEQHAGYLLAHEADPADPKGRPYTNHFADSPKTAAKLSLREILQQRDWDIITIQQVSRQSFIADSFEPHASVLVAYLRKHEPDADIFVHQTWAYREDSPLFTEGTVDAANMHARLRANYLALAERHGLGFLPVGDAFAAARKTPRWTFRFPDPNFNYEAPIAPAVPDQTGSLNVGWVWRTDTQTQQRVLRLDSNHANTAGQYLGAAVFYQTIFEDDVTPVAFVPNGLSEADAADLRTIAAATVRQHADTRSTVRN